ncbi:MAG: hypothetical protein A2044_07225 [Candidatus Firestonebacteria bacterium GWA2_43_8]|nr:MAG: hypothetical protein A2044_07225 [Candidatus Firestonebacteria bacterium GWA2_43_8]
MKSNQKDIKVLQELAKKYMELANKPVQEERRKLWSDHFSKKRTRPPVMISYGMWVHWCKEVLADDKLECEESFYREYEKAFKLMFLMDETGDDTILEPWLELSATKEGTWDNHWGIERQLTKSAQEGGAFHLDAMMKDWSDMSKLKALHHKIDEEDTKKRVEKLSEAIGKIITIDVIRNPVYLSFTGDISTDLANIRGLEQIMIDMYESPKELHELLAFMRDGILRNHKEAEEAGHFKLTSHNNQAMRYCNELERPKPNSKPVKRKDLWGFFAAQEFALISPEFHDEFLLQYQLPIIENFAMIHYGCCEDLTKKIDMLRKVKNLRSIAVTPVADYRKCAEQIKKDYVCSYRPNPTDMVCAGWDEDRIKRIITDAKDAFKDSYWHIHLKDIETLQGDLTRMKRWVKIVRGITG